MAPALHPPLNAASRPRRRLRHGGRRAAAFGLAALGLLLGGCVYLRLLAFKRQLADFDRHFTLQTDDGLRLGCLTPVLLPEDFRWLGLTPETVKTLGSQSEQWRIRWVKQLAPGAPEAEARDIEMELFFTAGKFTRLYLPECYFVFVPKPFFAGLLRSLGSAGVDRSRRLAEVSFSRAERDALTARVMATSLAMLLGAPTEQTMDAAHTVLRYRYTPVPPESKHGVFDLAFTFDTPTGQLQRLHGRSPVGELAFNFESPTAPTAPTVPTAPTAPPVPAPAAPAP